MSLKVWSIGIAALAVPFVLELTTGCTFDTSGLCPDPCVQPPDGSAPNSYVCSCTCGPTSLKVGRRVIASADDAEQRIADASMDLTSDDLDLSPTRLAGVRFQQVSVPFGATIIDARVQFTASESSVLEAVTYNVVGEDSDNAGPFTTAAGNIFARPVTVASAVWSPDPWVSGANGGDQRTPNLSAIVQEIVDGAGWAQGNAIVILFAVTSGTGIRRAETFDGSPDRAAVLEIEYREPSPTTVGPLDLPVCVPPNLNPNLNMGLAPGDMELGADCTDRVQPTLEGLTAACGYPSDCTCTLQADSFRFGGVCNDMCVENPVDMDCSDFDPVGGTVTATNAPGDMPICLTNSPLASVLFGRRTTCEVAGMVDANADDESASSMGTGVLKFLGTPCPGGGCAVGMEYRLDIGNLTFSNFWGSETFSNLAGLGNSLPNQTALLDGMGDGMFGQESTGVSARGTRGGDQQALVTTNSDVLSINLLFGAMNPTCTLSGSLLGSVDPEAKRCEPAGPDASEFCDSDDDCEDDDACSGEVCNCETVSSANLSLTLSLTGTVVNQPPTADAGEDQTVECMRAAVTNVTLDGSGSSDLDDNIALFNWFRGDRTGPLVGVEETSDVEQALGPESYVLRVIDAFGESDEDRTMVTVEDTIAPVLDCAVGKHVLLQTNHNLVNVGLTASAEDSCEGTLPVVVKVFGDENDQTNTGDGVHSPDAKNLVVGKLRLRAERVATANGRVYLIVTEASDSSGNRGFDCCTVIVPKNPKLQASLQSAEMQAVAAQNYCLANDGTAPPSYFKIGDGPVIGSKQ